MGDVVAALRSADHVFEGTFSCPAIYHHPMEAPMSTIASVTREGVEFWAPTNHPFDIAHDAAKLFDLAPERVRVHGPHVGGNFGAKHMSAEILATAALSLRVGRPVKFVPTDEEGFRVTSRHAMDFTARIGVAADGMLVALDVELDINTGAYFTGAAIATGNAVTSCWGAYRVPNFRVRARTAYTNRVPAGTFRNTGKNQTTFALDCAMDSLARQMGVNPTELRRKNFVRRGETQATASWSRNGKVAAPQIPPLDTDLSDLVDHALHAIGWDGRPSKTGRQGDGETGRELAPESLSPSPSRPVSPSPRLARGRGLAVSLRRGANIGDATAMAAIDRAGVVTISHNAPDVGEGSHTVISVVAARSLGVPQSQVRVGMPDTANQLFFAGTSSQRTTVQMGNAVRNACEHLKIELARTAAESYGGSPEDWRVADGELRRGEERYTLADLMKSLPHGVILRGVGSYEHATVEDPQFGGHDYWAPGVAAVELEVDRETGEIHILQYAAVADAGTIMHYRSAKAQIEGGAVMGFGAALSEQIVYEEGQLLNADAFQYRLPLMSDVPENFQVLLLENGDGPGPFGAKGVAQVSIPCVAPAVCNAIYDAVGVRLTSIPFTPESILRALGTLE
jgi:CO/xanthine dehydrogenase Mo-binding subunit